MDSRLFAARRLPTPDWKQWIAVLLALAALGAAPVAPAGTPDGKLLGILSATLLFGLVTYAVYLTLRPLFDDADEQFFIAIGIVAMLWIVKTLMLFGFEGFGTDVGTYQAWALQIADQGPAHTYQQGYFLDYPPGYLYALWIAGTFAHAMDASGTALRIIVESPSLIADALVSLVLFAYVRGGDKRRLAMAAMLMFALNPALLFDTVIWGQSDSVLVLVMFLAALATIAGEFEISWALAALSVLIKPQGLMLLPVLGVWILFEGDWGAWIRAAVVGIGIFIIGIAPFQIGHAWNWIINLYGSTAAYYHETSVNAFNFLALLGGLRQPDSNTFLGISFFTLGMASLVPLYAYVAYILWRTRNETALFYAAFVALFGFFMFAPRMHERYLYPALVFAIPLALESTEMMAVFGTLTLTCLFNLAYIKHTLESPQIFLDPRDLWAMLACGLNVIAFAATVHFGLTAVDREASPENSLIALFRRLIPPEASERRRQEVEDLEARPLLPWLRLDTIIVSALTVFTAVTRFWHIGTPPEIVFDEVHFVGQAREYLHAETFLDPHPPVAKLLIAMSIGIFGDHSWSWRVPNAILGTILVAVTYLLGRRMFKDRLAATLAAGCVALDGFFLVDSRIACIDIVYITFAAISYLVLFRFLQTATMFDKRKLLIPLGIALGICLGSKLYIPVVACVLAAVFVAWDIWKMSADQTRVGGNGDGPDPYRIPRVFGAVTTLATITAIFYLSTFLINYFLGWWGGIADLFKYYKDVVWYEDSVSSATHPYSSKWWSWPLMLRPVAYWQHFPKEGKVSTVWGGGNPLIWWGALTGMMFNIVYAIERPSVTRFFMLSGYLTYVLMWVWIGRTLFLYHYMPAVYLGFLALAGVLAEVWYGREEMYFEHLALLTTIVPAMLLGMGSILGFVAATALFVGWGACLALRPADSGKYVVCSFVAGVIVLFIYFFPVWTAIPIQRAGYYARMWLQGPGIRNWI